MPKAILPKGTYYIGDPCYITKGDPGYHWYEKLLDMHYNHNDQTGVYNVDNVMLFMQNTAEGDGAFDGFYVDSGLICIMKIDGLLNDPRFNFKNMSIKGTTFAAFPEDFEVSYEEGTFQVGPSITIHTV